MIPRPRKPEERIEKESSFREYILLNRKLMRQANEKARAASRSWGKLNAEFMDLAARMGWDKDPLKLAEIKKQNLGLNDAFDTWHFWQRESVRISSLIQAEYQARKLLEDLDRDLYV